MEFVAHPKDIPLHIEEVSTQSFQANAMETNGFAGIICLTPQAYNPGQCVQLKLAEIDPNFCVTGRIVWCDKEADEFRVAIEFPCKDDCYCVRMVEQLSHIEHYRRQAKQQGRRLNFNDAAAEWIQKFAASFPAFTA